MRMLAICLWLCPGVWFAFWVALGVSLLSLPAHAEPTWVIGQPSDEPRFTDLSFGMLFDGGYGFGLTPSVQLGVPILNNGLIPSVNDSFYVEPGLLISARFRQGAPDLVWVIPEFGPRWDFHLTPTWDVFASVKLGWAIGHEGDFWVRGTAGALWWLAPTWSLRLETAYGAVVGPGGYLGLGYRFL